MADMEALLDSVDGFLEKHNFDAAMHGESGIETGHDIRHAIVQIRKCSCSIEGVCVTTSAQALLSHMQKVDQWTDGLARAMLGMADFSPKEFGF